MDNKKCSCDPCDCCKCKKDYGNMCGNGIYGLGLIGAAYYYIQIATSFPEGALGVLKAFVWPAMLVYKLLETLGL